MSIKPAKRRVLVTINEADYRYCVRHFIKITPIASDAIAMHVQCDKQRYVALQEEIPSNARKAAVERGETPLPEPMTPDGLELPEGDVDADAEDVDDVEDED